MKTDFKSVVYFTIFSQSWKKSLYSWVRVCVDVRKYSRQVSFYKSHLLHRKWHTPLSGQVLCVLNVVLTWMGLIFLALFTPNMFCSGNMIIYLTFSGLLGTELNGCQCSSKSCSYILTFWTGTFFILYEKLSCA